ncbi:hypothetical protein ATCC90586_004081 [Pythium insidiosum]|nr:hypothetical protein ATCC90586_004081 [Pythium insidiosum]
MAPSISIARLAQSVAPERATLPRGRCSECEAEDQPLDGILSEYFRLQVCLTCKQDRNLRYGWYELISKSKAKEDYALPESFFHGLPFYPKTNPRHESFAPLKLYLKRTMMDEALRLYGDDANLQRTKETRKRKAYDRAAQRTRKLLKQTKAQLASGDMAQPQAQAGTSSSGHDSKPLVPLVVDQDHQHQFATEHYDEEANSWVKQCSCGMRVHFEKW